MTKTKSQITGPELKYQDLLYFGYDWSDEGSENAREQARFIKEIEDKFPNVRLRDAYDNIKGYRQEVYLPENENDNYYSWLIGKQWVEVSLTMQMIMISASGEPEQKERFDKYLLLAKKQYPESFKPEALNH